ncbi:hypothetical protein I5E68_06635 [Novosphingobium sp. YJ-S2-02]|uniref:Uncharacterized protein n=1 Tax=Novosphingobium aureum TaxID=2792964 RepID=A0A931MKB6_9SPHN|nr:hypothetical protein [Novosphingobium aureum]MBH0112628.1 hypothetical protein [Novosphingobium aureum]
MARAQGAAALPVWVGFGAKGRRSPPNLRLQAEPEGLRRQPPSNTNTASGTEFNYDEIRFAENKILSNIFIFDDGIYCNIHFFRNIAQP